MIICSRTRLLVFVVSALLAALPAFSATPSDSALTDDGRILRAVEGFYGDLFPEGTAAAEGIRSLALDIESADGVERLLVPTSETWRPERSPTLIWDSASSSTILLWLSGTGEPDQFTIEFTGRRDGEWGAVESGRNGAGKLVILDQEPTTFLSYDELSFQAADDSTITLSRHVVHLVWREAATEKLLYMPLVFIDGLYIGWSDVVTLSQVLSKANEAADLDHGMSESLRQLFAVEQLGDSLLLGVADPEHNHLGVISVELLPISLAALADEVLDSILEHHGVLDEGGLQGLSDGIRAQIISVGQTVNLNPAVTEYTAIRVANWLRAVDPALGRDAIAKGARAQTLDIGSSVLAYTVVDANVPQGEITEIDLSDFLDTEDGAGQMNDLVRLEVRLDVPAPAIDAPDIEALIGSKGARLMLVWPRAEGAELAYTEYRSRGGGWSDTQALELSESFTHEQAIELLRRRLN